MGNSTVFIVHGRDQGALESLLRWFRQRSISVEAITFERLAVPGETIPTELERIAALGDAAVILITPDDLGRLKTDAMDNTRARQNVWIELGWFWARLGRRRTLLLLKGSVDIPSDLRGVIYLHYNDSLREVSDQLQRFVESLTSTESNHMSEVVRVAATSRERSWEYQQVVETAEQSAVITGIGMINLRQYLPALLKSMQERKANLELDLIVLDIEWCSRYSKLFAQAYRPNLTQDILQFEHDLAVLLDLNNEVRSRVHLYRYGGIISFSATVADPANWGSLMLVETILPRDESHIVERPRVLLRRRCIDGLYDRYWRAIATMRRRAVLAREPHRME